MTMMQLPDLTYVRRSVSKVYDYLENNQSAAERTWINRSENEILREMVACIIGSRVSHEAASHALQRICSSGILDEIRGGISDVKIRKRFMSRLRGEGSGQGYPFWRMRGNQVMDACNTIYDNGGSIKERLSSFHDEQRARDWLVGSIPGLGPKQSSMFLRNIGFSKSLAILDVHVLDYMQWHGISSKPRSAMSNITNYKATEIGFIRHAESMRRTLNIFDVAVWIVVRVAKEEGGLCLS